MAPEFSRPEPVDAIADVPRHLSIEAHSAECAALAARFGLIGITRLAATLSIKRESAGIRVEGRVTGAVIQSCIVTGDPVPALVDEPLLLLFVADDQPASEEVELSIDALDTVPFNGTTIDLGEAAAETMALALDPFPRGARADAALREAGVLQEGEAGPFAALAGLRDRLGKGG